MGLRPVHLEVSVLFQRRNRGPESCGGLKDGDGFSAVSSGGQEVRRPVVGLWRALSEGPLLMLE